MVVARGDDVLYAQNGSDAVVPASVNKLVTAFAVLDAIGGDVQLRTTVRAEAAPVDGTIGGDLWLVGTGDPVLGTDAWARAVRAADIYTSLDELANRVVQAGVRVVSGSVLGDESRYDAERYLPSWPRHFVDDGEIGPMSALTVNDGFGTWSHPGTPFTDPPVDAAALFRQLLVDRGVAVAGGARAGSASATAVVVASVDSRPVAELTARMLRDSDNGTAELLVKELGLRASGRGSTASGTAAVVDVLRRRGVQVGASVIADGSGLSERDRASCELLAAVMARAPAALRDGLPVAGRTGTLKNRFVGTPAAGRLRAKTGSIDGVAALAGTAESRSGQRLEFSYVINGLNHGDSGRALQEAFGTALVTAG